MSKYHDLIQSQIKGGATSGNTATPATTGDSKYHQLFQSQIKPVEPKKPAWKGLVEKYGVPITETKPEVKPVETPKKPVTTMPVGKYGETELSQGKPQEEKEQGLLAKTARVLLPREMELKYGLVPEDQKTNREKIIEKYENAYGASDFQVLSEKIIPAQIPLKDAGKLPTQTAKEYVKETDFREKLPFVGGALQTAKALEVYVSAKKMANGTANSKDVYTVAKYQAEAERNKTLPATITDIVTSLPGFATELGATMGIYTLGKKAVEKSVLKLLQKTVNSNIKKSLLATGAGVLAGTTLQTIPARATYIPAETIKNLTPEIISGKTETNDLVTMVNKDSGETFGKALTYALGDSWTEVVSERTGGIFSKLTAPIQNKLAKLAIFKAISKLNDKLGVSVIMQKLDDAFAWNGTFPEIFEEYVGAGMRGVLTEMGLGKTGWVFPSKQDVLAMLVSFSIPGIGATALSATTKGTLREGGEELTEEEKALNKFDELIGALTKEEIKDIPMKNIPMIRDQLKIGTGSPNLNADEINGQMKAMDTYHNVAEETAFEVGEIGGAPVIKVDVVEYPDGKWGYKYTVNVNGGGIQGDYLTNPVVNSKEEAIDKAREDINKWVYEESESNPDDKDYQSVLTNIYENIQNPNLAKDIEEYNKQVKKEAELETIKGEVFEDSDIKLFNVVRRIKEKQFAEGDIETMRKSDKVILQGIAKEWKGKTVNELVNIATERYNEAKKTNLTDTEVLEEIMNIPYSKDVKALEKEVKAEKPKEEIMTGTMVAGEAKRLGSDQGGISDFTYDQIKKEKYSRVIVDIVDLRKSDPDLDEYLKTSEIREFEGEPFAMPPIISSKGEVIDGYNRIAQVIANNEKEIEILKGIAKIKTIKPRVEEAVKKPRFAKPKKEEIIEEFEGKRIDENKEKPTKEFQITLDNGEKVNVTYTRNAFGANLTDHFEYDQRKYPYSSVSETGYRSDFTNGVIPEGEDIEAIAKARAEDFVKQQAKEYKRKPEFKLEEPPKQQAEPTVLPLAPSKEAFEKPAETNLTQEQLVEIEAKRRAEEAKGQETMFEEEGEALKETISNVKTIVDNLDYGYQLDKEGLREYGFDIEATGFGGEMADVAYYNGEPVIAYRWEDDVLEGISVAKKYRKKGIATEYLKGLLKEGELKVADPNKKLLNILEKIGNVSDVGSNGIATVTPFEEETDALEAQEEAEFRRTWSVEMPLEPTTKETINKTSIMNWVEKTFNIPIKGKVTNKWKAAGMYYPKKWLVRLEKWGELPVMVHEVAHHIDLGLLKKQYPEGWRKGERAMTTELADLDYDQKKRRTKEGFAEFMRYKMTTDLAPTKAPIFNKFFEEFLKKNPKLDAQLKELRSQLDIWAGQGAENRIIQHIDWKGEHTSVFGIKNKIKRAVKFINEKFNDEFYIPQKITSDIEKVLDRELRPSENPAKMAEFSKSKAGAIAHTFITKKAIDEQGNVIGKSLKEILKPIKRKEIRQFISYAVSKRVLNLEARKIESGFDLKDAKFIIDKYKNETWDNVAQEISDWAGQLMDWVTRAGGLDDASAKKIKDANPIYLMFKRAFLNEAEVIKQGTGGYVDTGSGFKRIKGSGRPIINPIEAMMSQASALIAKAQKIRIASLWVDLAKQNNLGGFITEVPAPTNAVTFDSSQIKNYMEEVTGEEWENEGDLVTVFTQGKRYTGKDNVVTIFKDGKLKFYEIHPDLYNSFKAVDPLKLGPISKLLAPFSRLLRLGATGLKVSFGIARNPFRDALSYVVFSKRNGVTVFDPAKGVYTSLTAKPGSATWRFKALGGALSGQIGLDRASTRSAYDEILLGNLKKIGKPLLIAKHPVDTLRDIISVTEMGPRSVEMEKNYELYTSEAWKEKHPDWTEEDAFIQAFLDAQDVTVNFTKSGKWARQLNEITAFFNVAIRGPEKMFRSFKERPISSTVKALLWLTSIALVSWWRNKDKEWYKNLEPAYKYNNLFFDIPGLGIIRLPIPFELGTMFMAMPQAVMDTFKNKDTQAIEGIIQILKTQIPNPIPSAFGPLLDVATNKNYLGSPIESGGMQYKYPTERYYDYTTSLAKNLSKAFDKIGMELSPIQIDYLVDAYSGGFLRQFKGSGGELYNLPVLSDLMLRDPLYPKRQLGNFFDDYGTIGQKVQSKIATKEEETKYRKLKRFYEVYKNVQADIVEAKANDDTDGVNEYYKEITDKLSTYGYD